jgi:hypothetical protein
MSHFSLIFEIMNKLTSTTVLLLVVCTASLFLSCVREENDFDRQINAAAINDYLDTIPTFAEPAPASLVEGEISYAEDQTASGLDVLCEKQTFDQTFVLQNLTLNAFNNTTATNTAGLYPGAIIQLKDLQDIGDINPIGNFERQPMQINSTLGDFRVVEDPSSRGDVDKMIKEIEQQGESFAANISYEVVEAYSLEQAMYSLGIDARYLGNSVSADLSIETEVEKKSVFIKFFQVYHTVSITRPTKAADFFGNSVTREDLQSVTGADRPLGYIEEVAYGRVLVGNFTYSGTEIKTSADLKVRVQKGLGSGGVDFSADDRRVMRNTTFKVAILGGDSQEAAQVSGSGAEALEEAYDFLAKGGEDRSLGVPVQYKIRYLANNQLFALGGAAGFQAPRCDVLNNHVTITNISLTKFPPNNPDGKKWDWGAVANKNKEADVYPAISRLVGNTYQQEANWEDKTAYQLTSSDLPKGYSVSYPVGKSRLRNDFAVQFYDNDKGEPFVEDIQWMGTIYFNFTSYLRTAANPQPSNPYPASITIERGGYSAVLNLTWEARGD